MNDNSLLAIIKIFSMITMFLMILIVGSIPLRISAFKTNELVMSFSAAFSGGLFLSVGIIHLLPEAVANFKTTQIDDDKEYFPIAYLLTVLSFTLILWIEKIATNHQNNKQSNTPIRQIELQNLNPNQLQNRLLSDEVDDEENLTPNSKQQRASLALVALNIRKSLIQNPQSLTPYILQIAIGIHAVFEGLAIGIEDHVSHCMGIAAAVICHKWAEGLTLGQAFRNAGVDLKTSTHMIVLQAIMNPVGIGIGWILQNQGKLVTGVFQSISAGTFIYIATIQVIVEEFSISRYKVPKFLMFIFAIGFISSIWFMEQLAN